MFIEWNDSFSLHIDELDGHHKRLIELLNRSYFLILQESGQEELARLLDELIEYAQYHFAAEEDFMRLHQYDKLDWHVIEHFSFINKVLSFKKEMDNRRTHLSIEIFDFIRNWLVDHILKIDTAMGRSLNSNAHPAKI